MPFEVVFTAGYGLLLIAGAIGLHRLGRRDPSAWSSRMLAGYRAQHPEPTPAGPPDAFPHHDLGRLHSAVGAVACLAALLLTVAQLVRHHRPGEAVLLAGCAVAAAVVLRPLLRAARSRPAAGRVRASRAVPPER
ncbi:hypothetical protein [Actinoplanes regularis]|uniref:Uncharacterized protein n=1 Tax=Actinoplanes regularis TaxID=52697 RepID=A0A239F4J6_9ACTN|nr:hypothetical protein [Actinoplanes regularis]SNS51819.1 hypothetical protein SAMN06264365_11782 [Actinoplanes regularis]